MSTIIKLLLLQLCCISIVLAGSDQPLQQAISVVTRVVTIPGDYIYHPNIGTALKVHTRELNWNDAKAACIAEGGRLAVIDTPEKLQVVKVQKPASSAVWVGIKKKDSRWLTADKVTILTNLPWAKDQPEGVGDCVAVKKKGTGLYNRLCMWNQRFVCEIPIPTTIYQLPCTRN